MMGDNDGADLLFVLAPMWRTHVSESRAATTPMRARARARRRRLAESQNARDRFLFSPVRRPKTFALYKN